MTVMNGIPWPRHAQIIFYPDPCEVGYRCYVGEIQILILAMSRITQERMKLQTD